MTEHPPGVIALPCGESFRFAHSAIDLFAVRKPEGTFVDVRIGMDVALALNSVIRDMLENTDFQWVWFQADDHLYHDGLLEALLDREQDVIVPLIARRHPPYALVIYKGEEVEILPNGIPTANYENFLQDEIPESGVFPVHAAGSGGMLVRRNVLEAIPDPWFESSSGAFINDDLEFCRKARAAGFEICADADQSMGHCSSYVVIPEHRSGRWGITLDFSEGNGQNRIWFGDDPRKVADEQAALA